VIPLDLTSSCEGTIWIVSHQEGRGFDAEHVRVMTGLGNFAASVLRFARGRSASQRDSTILEREIIWAEYVSRIASHDQLALGALIGEAQPLIFSTALRILSFRQDAEEVVGDVFERVWENANSYDRSRGGVGAWLSIMARSRAINRLRSRALECGSEAALSVACSSAASPEGSAAAIETRALLLRAVKALPPEQRRAIELVYFQGLTIAEIAKQLGHPLGSVTSRVRSGLMKLRRMVAAMT
jgi:RNA polymerase sigma-70 factor, ECF subfamily